VASDPWYVSEVWGWSMLDLEWELETNERLVILAFAQGVDTSSLLDLIAERNYATDLYEGFTLYPHNFDMSLVWLRPPFSAFQNAAFMEDDRVLMLAPTLPALRAAVDAYSGRTSNLTQDPSALALALALDESVGTLLLTQAAACGAPVLDATERAYDLAGVGYRPTELGTRGLTALARLDEVVMNIVTLSAPGELFSQVCSRSADFLACAD
jgi:hypothetical protein